MAETSKYKALEAMTVSLLEQLLAKVDQPDQFPAYAAQEFLEISGAKTAIIFQQLVSKNHQEHRILAVTPARRSRMANDPAISRLIALLHDHEQLQLWRPEDDHPAAVELTRLGVGPSLAVPFLTSGERAGGLLLFDLPDEAWVNSLRDVFGTMSQVVSLALRSALLFEAQDLLIESHSLELNRQRRSLQAFFDNKLVGMIQKDAADCYQRVNRQWETMTGYHRSELLNKQFPGLLAGPDRQEREELREQLVSGASHSFQHTSRYIRKDGSRFWGAASATGLYDDQGNYTGMITLIIDVTEQKEALLQLQQSEDRFRSLLNNQTDAVFLFKFLPKRFSPFEEVNNTAIERYGYSRAELLQLTALDLMDLDLLDDQQRAVIDNRDQLLSRRRLLFETVHVKKTGESFPVEINSVLIMLEDAPYVLSTVRDISERKAAEAEHRKLEEQLRQKFKMEAVGVMAGGIAHNFNNSLSIIIGNIELALLKTSDPAKVKELLGYARTAVLRSRDLIKQIMLYSRQGHQQKQTLLLPQIVEEALNLLRSTIPASVELVYLASPASRAVTISADPGRIQEALINLCSNAVFAMEEKGQLRIAIDTRQLQQKDIPAQAKCSPGDFVQLSVADTGSGMGAETLAKIFDPFFTTKAVDQGTGMGLSTVDGIMEQHNGLIEVNSAPGKGTTFELYFPIASQHAVESKAKDQSLPRGTGRILLVDDDEMLVNLCSLMLSEVGYQVTDTTSSRAALAQLEAAPEAFDLLITDQTMPGLSGLELIAAVRRVNPQLPIILCTGYSTKVGRKDISNLNIDAFCMKPLEMPELLQVVAQTLQRN